MNKINDFGIIKFEYPNDITNYMKDFMNFDPIYYGIYFRKPIKDSSKEKNNFKNRKLYGMCFNFFNTQTVYFLDKIFELKKLFKFVEEVTFYPLKYDNFISCCDVVIRKAFNTKNKIVEYNFGKYIVDKIMKKTLSDKYKIIKMNCFDFYFSKISNLIEIPYTPKIKENDFNYNFNENESIIIKSKRVIKYNYLDKKKELFVEISKLYWENKPLFLKLSNNLLINNNYYKLNFNELDKYIENTRLKIDKINYSIQNGFIQASDLKEVLNNMNLFLEIIHQKKIKYNGDDLYSSQNEKFHLQKLLLDDKNITIINSQLFNKEMIKTEDKLIEFDSKFFIKNINDDQDLKILKDHLKFINSIYMSNPTDKELIGLQNELVKKIANFQSIIKENF